MGIRAHIEWCNITEADQRFKKFGALAQEFAGHIRSEKSDDHWLISLVLPDSLLMETDLVSAVVAAENPESIRATVKDADSPLEILATLVSEAVSRDTKELDEVEIEIYRLEAALMKRVHFERASKALVKYRRRILVLKQRYEQTIDIVDAMLSAELSDKRPLHDIKRRAARILDAVKNVRDFVTEVRDAYHSAIQVRQNRLVQTFTVIAAIFMPLQLITGWFGMNFKIAAFEWVGSYPIVIGFCVVLVSVLLIVFKKKRLF